MSKAIVFTVDDQNVWINKTIADVEKMDNDRYDIIGAFLIMLDDLDITQE